MVVMLMSCLRYVWVSRTRRSWARPPAWRVHALSGAWRSAVGFACGPTTATPHGVRRHRTDGLAAGIARPARWGLLDALVASGCPPMREATFDVGPFAFRGGVPAVEASGTHTSVLDGILVDAAVAAGAELAGATSYHTRPAVQGSYFSYWSGVPVDGGALRYRALLRGVLRQRVARRAVRCPFAAA